MFLPMSSGVIVVMVASVVIASSVSEASGQDDVGGNARAVWG